MKKLSLYVFPVLLMISACSEQCIKGDCNNGYGTYTYADGSKYAGEFKDGKKHGQGTYTYQSGSKYVGEFKDDKKHGQGTFTFASGKVMKGVWKNGKLVRVSGKIIN